MIKNNLTRVQKYKVVPFVEIGDLGPWRTGDMSEMVEVQSVGETRASDGSSILVYGWP